MERGGTLSQQCVLGRRILGTRTAHPYQPWAMRPAERSEMCHRCAVHLHSTGMGHALPWVSPTAMVMPALRAY